MKNILRVLCVLVLTALNSQAATYCVSTATGLRNALTDAENNNDFDTIKVTAGTYLTGGNAFTFSDFSGHGLEISGGWTHLPMAPCGARLGTSDIFSTVLDGNQTSAIMDVVLADAAPFVVSGLAFINGLSSGVAGLQVRKFDQDDTYEGFFIVENNVFVNNQSSGLISALELRGADRMDIRNNLFTENVGAFYVVRVGTNLGADYYFHNNTLVENDGRVRFENTLSNQLMVVNNVMNNNGGVDISVFGDGAWFLYNNNISSVYSSEVPISASNINLPNRFQPGVYELTPAVDSPLVDNGRTPCGFVCPFPTPFINNWLLGDYALAAQQREQGSAPDIGAFESGFTSDLIFWSTFD